VTIPLPSPARHLAEVGKRYPRAWRQVDEIRATRGRGLSWPDWCFLPLAGTYAIVSGGGTNRLSPKDAAQVSILGALAAWRVTQGIYRFDPDVFAAVWETPIEGDLPVGLLYRLPEWCVYVETPGRGIFHWPLSGFFAHLEWDANTGRTELRLLLDTEGAGLLPYVIHLRPEGLRESVLAMLQEAGRQGAQHGVPVDQSASTATLIAAEIMPLVSLVLYLCAQNAEIRDAGGTGRLPVKPAPKRVKGGERYFPPNRATVWDCGWRMGPALRMALSAAHDSAAEGDVIQGRAGPRPHIRRAHWHSFWTGPRQDPAQRKIALRWLPPIPVAVADAGELVPSVRNVPGS
jgi:hypothetical protein